MESRQLRRDYANLLKSLDSTMQGMIICQSVASIESKPTAERNGRAVFVFVNWVRCIPPGAAGAARGRPRRVRFEDCVYCSFQEWDAFVYLNSSAAHAIPLSRRRQADRRRSDPDRNSMAGDMGKRDLKLKHKCFQRY